MHDLKSMEHQKFVLCIVQNIPCNTNTIFCSRRFLIQRKAPYFELFILRGIRNFSLQCLSVNRTFLFAGLRVPRKNSTTLLDRVFVCSTRDCTQQVKYFVCLYCESQQLVLNSNHCNFQIENRMLICSFFVFFKEGSVYFRDSPFLVLMFTSSFDLFPLQQHFNRFFVL